MTIRISSMALKRFDSENFKCTTVTKSFTLRLICFTLLIIVFSQRTNSSAATLNSAGTHGQIKSKQKLLELHKHLRAINKPAVKTIQSPDGDIVDCILRYKQPAFDHPLLRNHTIQKFPTTNPHGVEPPSVANTTLRHPFQIWHLSGQTCPVGTVPVRRTTSEDLMRFESPQIYGRKTRDVNGQVSKPETPASPPVLKTEEAMIITTGEFYGASAYINVWHPLVATADESSVARMWVLGRTVSGPNVNSIEAGWQSYPVLYGDTRPRLFAYWTADSFRDTGCYDAQCPGFILITDRVLLGGAFYPTSIYGGHQAEVSMVLWKDAVTNSWWLKIWDVLVGYWPGHLLTDLRTYSSTITWGGAVVNSETLGRHTDTQMGSGRFAVEGFRRAAYFRNVKAAYIPNIFHDVHAVTTSAPHPNCYDVETSQDGVFGRHLYYGGPGRNPACP